MLGGIACTCPGACSTVAVAWPCTNTWRNTAAVSSAASLGPVTRTCITVVTSFSPGSVTRTMTPYCSTSGCTAPCEGASSGSNSSLASTIISASLSASAITASTAPVAAWDAPPSRGPPPWACSTTVFWPTVACTAWSWATAARRHRTHASESGWIISWSTMTPPSARAQCSWASWPLATPSIASAARRRFSALPWMNIFTDASRLPASGSSRYWVWPP
mmetsp:Transcript_71174/g.192429  ORF Transcript_71174/g.192429 Transcript_71174/m.192429 type:complete len:219 (-) Transcript_71174:39-695(-)